jgi:hypothetical protein
VGTDGGHYSVPRENEHFYADLDKGRRTARRALLTVDKVVWKELGSLQVEIYASELTQDFQVVKR